MKRFLLAMLMIGGCFLVGNFALGDEEEDEENGATIFDKTYEVKLDAFEEHVIETDNLIINNVVLNKQKNDYGGDKRMEQLTFAASLKGRSAKSQEVAVMMIGFDEAKTPLWTAKSLDSLYGKTVSTMQDQLKVPAGTLKNTANIWMRVIIVTSTN